MIKFTADKTRKLSKLALYNCEDLSYGALCRLLRKKDVKVNGKRVSDDVTLSPGDVVEFFYSPAPSAKYDVVYSDGNVIVVDKKGGYSSESVFADLQKAVRADGSGKNVYFIHRLDRNTSGLMIFALNAAAESELSDGFKKRTFDKYYIAEVKGAPREKSAELCAYLIKDAKNARVTVYDRPVKGSVRIKTGYETVREYDGKSLLRVKLFTGKTHQIRAHLAHIGHPVTGDGKYGDNAFNKAENAKSQRLKAVSLTLRFNADSPLYYLDGRTFSLPETF